MSGHLTYSSKSTFTPTNRGNDSDSDPEPPMAPPVIILSTSNGLGSRENQELEFTDADSGTEPRLPTSLPRSNNSIRKSERYNSQSRKDIKETETEPTPDPEPEPEPDPAPPIIILPTLKRPASSSPPRSISPPFPVSSSNSNSPTQFQPRRSKRNMGSKASKLSSKVEHGHSKLQPAVANSDKEQMKEPANYYSHRSKSMRRKAGRNAAGASPATAP